jgi:hypothetical protein
MCFYCPNKHTSARVGSLAARQMHDPDPKKRSVAGAALGDVMPHHHLPHDTPVYCHTYLTELLRQYDPPVARNRLAGPSADILDQYSKPALADMLQRQYGPASG